MHKITSFPIFFLAFFNSSICQNISNFQIENKSSIPRLEEVVSIPWSDIMVAFPKLDTSMMNIRDAKSNENIPFQFELEGKSSIQNLLILVSIPPKSIQSLVIKKEKAPIHVTRTYGRFVPERKEDFAWENDKIAFRMYGKELEKTPKEMAYGMDVWVKSTSRMVINERYKRGKYHENLGDGMDYYHVGLTLGAGNVAPILNDSIYYSKNYVRWQLLDNGPLRTTFLLEYDTWDVAGNQVSAIKKISLDAGSHLNKIEALYKTNHLDSLSLAVGIIKRKDPGTALLDEKMGIMGYWEPEMGDYGITGVGTIFPSNTQSMKITNQQLLSISKTPLHKPYIYYTGASWNKAGIFTNASQWFSYLYEFREKIRNPLLFSFK